MRKTSLMCFCWLFSRSKTYHYYGSVGIVNILLDVRVLKWLVWNRRVDTVLDFVSNKNYCSTMNYSVRVVRLCCGAVKEKYGFVKGNVGFSYRCKVDISNVKLFYPRFWFHLRFKGEEREWWFVWEVSNFFSNESMIQVGSKMTELIKDRYSHLRNEKVETR